MDRIKKIEDVILRNDMVLAKLCENKNSLIITNVTEDKNDFDHCEVVAKGVNVNSIEIGDIILKGTPMGGFKYRDDKYGVFTANNINLAVRKENFDENYKHIKLN